MSNVPAMLRNLSSQAERMGLSRDYVAGTRHLAGEWELWEKQQLAGVKPEDQLNLALAVETADGRRLEKLCMIGGYLIGELDGTVYMWLPCGDVIASFPFGRKGLTPADNLVNVVK